MRRQPGPDMAGGPTPSLAERRALFMQTLYADLACALIVITALLMGYQFHQLFAAVALGVVGVIGTGVAWTRFFRRWAALQRAHGPRPKDLAGR